MITFLLTVALSSSFITTQNSRPVQAESLLYNLTCIVRGLISTDCPSGTEQPPPTQNPKTPPPSGTDTSGGTTPSNNQPTDTSQSIEMNQELLTQLPTIPEMKPALFESGTGNFVLPSARGVSSVSANVLGASDTAALSTTPHGWNIVGVPWYWWMLAITGVAGLYVVVRSFVTRSFVGIVK